MGADSEFIGRLQSAGIPSPRVGRRNGSEAVWMDWSGPRDAWATLRMALDSGELHWGFGPVNGAGGLTLFGYSGGPIPDDVLTILREVTGH
jgi:hypothetical protein